MCFVVALITWQDLLFGARASEHLEDVYLAKSQYALVRGPLQMFS